MNAAVPDALLLNRDPQLVRLVCHIRRTALSLTTALCCLILLGWLLPPLAKLLPAGWYLMQSNTALCFLLSVLALSSTNHSVSIYIRLLTAGSMILLSGSALLTHLSGTDLAINQFLATRTASSMPHVMSVQTALFFILAAVTILLLEFRARGVLIDISTFTLVALIILLGSGYAFHVSDLYAQSPVIMASPQTLVSMILLTISLITCPDNPRFYTLFVQRDIGSRIARIAIPITLIIPIVMVVAEMEVIRSNLAPLPMAVSVTTAALCVVMIVMVYILAIRVRVLEIKIKKMAVTDELTELYNLKGFYLLAEQMVNLALRNQQSFCLVYFDLDGLKKVNDHYGHNSGSDMIRQFASMLTSSFRKTDIIARIGGDEFVVLCTNSVPDSALTRLADNTLACNRSGKNPFTMAYSHGCQCSTADARKTLKQLLHLADEAMYQNKKKRRHGGEKHDDSNHFVI